MSANLPSAYISISEEDYLAGKACTPAMATCPSYFVHNLNFGKSSHPIQAIRSSGYVLLTLNQIA